VNVGSFLKFLLVLSNHVIHAFWVAFFFIVEALFKSVFLGFKELLKLSELFRALVVDLLKLLLMKSFFIFKLLL
jgi:hypothetical protein